MSKMTVDEVLAEKEKLEKVIGRALENFTKASGLCVNTVATRSFPAFRTAGGEHEMHYSVQIRIEL